MTPLSCNCLSRPAPSLVILCSEPTRRSPGIVSCSGSHQPVQMLTLPLQYYSPPPLCHCRSCWCSPLAVPLADSPRLLGELMQEAPSPHFLLSSHPHCQLHKHMHSLHKTLNNVTLNLLFSMSFADISQTPYARAAMFGVMKSSNKTKYLLLTFHFTCQLQK